MSSGSKEPEEKAWHKNVFVHNEEICFKLDTGAEANVLPLSIFTGKKLYELCELGKTEIMLISYGNPMLKPEGCVDLLCKNFYVCS